MSRFTFLHAADLHLDTPFAGLGRVEPSLAERLRDASLQAWDRLVQKAIDQDVAFVLLAGDIYDGAERGLRAQLRFRDGCARLAGHGIPVFIVHGNHDPLGGWSAVRHWPEDVTIFPAGSVEARPVYRDGVHLATIRGISFDRPDVAENLSLRFPEIRTPDEGFSIGVLHCAVGETNDHHAYAPCTLDDLRRRAIDYWALGHIHGHTVLDRNPSIVYPGCLQGRSPKPGETGAKGAVMVTVTDRAVTGIEFVPLAEIVFDDITVTIDDIADTALLAETLVDKAGERAHAAPGGAIVSATLTGSGPIHDDLRRPGAANAFLTQLREAAGAPEGRMIWWRGLRDRSTPSIDWEALRQRDDLVAAVVRRGDTLLANPEVAATETELAWSMGDRLARQRPDEAERTRLLTEAIRLAVKTLESGQ